MKHLLRGVAALAAASFLVGCTKDKPTMTVHPTNATVYDWKTDPRCLDENGKFDEGFGGDDFDCQNMDETKWAK